MVETEVEENKKYMRQGECKRCGRCCESLVIAFPDIDGKAAFMKYHGCVIEEFEGHTVAIVPWACENLVKHDDGTTSCKIYQQPPRLCVNYPNRPDIYWDCLAKKWGCGYSFVEYKFEDEE